MLRGLCGDELEEIEKAARRSTRALGTDGSWLSQVRRVGKVDYVQQGNFMVAVLHDGIGISIGVAKRNPSTDQDCPAIACKIALHRAVKNPGIPLGA